VDFTIARIYEESSLVTLGTVASLDADRRVAEVRIDETLKGKAPAARWRIQVLSPESIFPRIRVNDRAVLCTGGRGDPPIAIIHLADSWLLGQGTGGAASAAWRVEEPYKGAQGFPGDTASLARLLRDLKRGKPGIQNVLDASAFGGNLREVASLKAQPLAATSADLDGDGKVDLVVATGQGARVFLDAAGAAADATERMGLAGAAGMICAAGDVNEDGRADLLIGTNLWLNGPGTAFTRSTASLGMPQSEWLAVALIDVDRDRRADVAALARDGTAVILSNPGSADRSWRQSRRVLWTGGERPLSAWISPDWRDDGGAYALVVRSDGITRYALGAEEAAPADFARLTGQSLAGLRSLENGRLNPVLTAAADLDGNGKTDLLLWGASGALALLNRGYGCFAVDENIIVGVTSPGGVSVSTLLAPPTIAVPGQRGEKCQSLLLLTKAGRLYELGAREGTP